MAEKFPPAAERVMQILNIFTSGDDIISLKELSEQLAIPIASLYRIINCMISYGYIIEDSVHPNFYKLGTKFLLMGRSRMLDDRLINVSKPYRDSLVSQTTQACQLSVLTYDGIMILEQVLPVSVPTYVAALGQNRPINISASGKVLVACMDSSSRKKFIQRASHLFVQNTYKTISDVKLFEKELDLTKIKGYGKDQEEFALGVGCIAVPLMFDNKPVAALGLTGSIQNYEAEENLERFKVILMNVCKSITSQLR